jgi:hypothetical protein
MCPPVCVSVRAREKARVCTCAWGNRFDLRAERRSEASRGRWCDEVRPDAAGAGGNWRHGIAGNGANRLGSPINAGGSEVRVETAGQTCSWGGAPERRPGGLSAFRKL